MLIEGSYVMIATKRISSKGKGKKMILIKENELYVYQLTHWTSDPAALEFAYRSFINNKNRHCIIRCDADNRCAVFTIGTFIEDNNYGSAKLRSIRKNRAKRALKYKVFNVVAMINEREGYKKGMITGAWQTIPTEKFNSVERSS